MSHYEGSVFSLPGLLLAGTGSKMTTEELIHQLLGVTQSPAYTCTIQEAWGQQTQPTSWTFSSYLLSLTPPEEGLTPHEPFL